MRLNLNLEICAPPVRYRSYHGSDILSTSFFKKFFDIYGVIWYPYKLIFLHLERTGGTYLETQMATLTVNFGGKHDDIQTIKTEHPDNWQNFHKFTVIRNPYDRACCLKRRQWPTMKDMNSEELIDEMVNRTTLFSHTPTQEEFGELDKIFRYENYQEICNFMNEWTQTNLFQPIPPRVYNYREWLPDEVIRTINEYHKIFFDEFGYDRIDV